jgi:predicted extracellular nuclease
MKTEAVEQSTNPLEKLEKQFQNASTYQASRLSTYKDLKLTLKLTVFNLSRYFAKTSETKLGVRKYMHVSG